MQIKVNIEEKGQLMFLHEQMASGDYGGQKFKLVRDAGGYNLVLQLYDKEKPEWKSYVLKIEDLTKAMLEEVFKEADTNVK